MTILHAGHVALAGRPNVGKSSLLNRLVGAHLAIVSPKAQTTRMPVTGLCTVGDTQLVLHDLPGLLDPAYELHERMQQAALRELDRADIILHLHPATEAPAPSLVTEARLPRAPRAPIVTVYSKADLVSPEIRARLAEAGGFPVSAEKGRGIEPLLAYVAARLPASEALYDPEDIGAQPMRFFVEEYLREAAFLTLGDEVPYAMAAQVEEFREDANPVYIRVTLYVERESQRGIVIGKGGRIIKRLGTHARERLEALLEAPVFLDLWVKVLKDWRRDPAALARLGFPVPGARA